MDGAADSRVSCVNIRWDCNNVAAHRNDGGGGGGAGGQSTVGLKHTVVGGKKPFVTSQDALDASERGLES